MQNLKRALGRDKRRRLLLTLKGWAVARAEEFGAFAESRSTPCVVAVSFS